MSSRDELSDARRADAIASSIAVILGTLTIAEIERLDAELKAILAERDQTWWARHAGESHWHLVAEVSGGSVATACNGRWSIRDDFENEARPARADRCGACQQAYRQMRIGQLAGRGAIERGLVELQEVTRG